MTMEKLIKHETQVNFQAANPTMETCPVSELLEDSGNCRQSINLHLVSDSLFSEQQKLRHVLDWAHSFLSSGSDVHHEFCRADSLILADEERRETQKKSQAYKHSSAAEYLHPISCAASGNEAFGPFTDDPCIPFSFTLPFKEEYRETPENMKRIELQDPTNKQTPSQENNCRTSSLFISNQRQDINLSDRNTNQTDGATCSIKESTLCRSDVESKVSYKTAGAQSEGDISGHQMELSKVKVDGKVGTQKEAAKQETEDARMGKRKGKMNEESSLAFAVYADNNMNNGEMEYTSNLSLSCHLKIPPTLTIYERYQLCVDQLHHLRLRQSQHIDPGCFTESPAEERKTEEEIAPQNPAIKKHLNKAGSKRVTAAEMTKKRSSDVINKNQDRSQYNGSRATPTEHRQTKHRDNLTVKETPAAICAERNTVTSNTHLDLDSNKCGELKRTAGGIISTPMGHMGTAPGAALTTNQGLFPERIGRNPDVRSCQSGVKGQKTKAGGQGASLRLCEKSSVSLSSPTNREILQRPQSSGVNKHTKRHTPEDTPLHDDPEPTSPAPDALRCKQTNEYSPAGVPVCVRWLCLPDEVWLSILSLLPLSDLCRVLQVCSRLHTLATDHTLWRNVRIENCNLTERWLLCVGRRRPRSLCLYSCSGLSLTSCGLEMFFTLCRNFLEELKVTSCTGPGLHGDQMLPLIGQLCHHVTSVDVSWCGATDTGVKALSDCCPGLQLKSLVLNGCHVTDDPLMKLIMRHKESLCRLEVFGCQFLTPSCLQTVYEMCPGLQHLNIGQVPKVNTHCLTVMTSQLKCLISLNLTGLQAVSDATVDTLLQNSVDLQSLTFSSCPGVTNLTLHSIRKYTPGIRSLDVSGCKAVTDAGVQSLALGCRRLQQLDLSSTGTGNRGVTLLANYCSGHLHTVKLSFCHITSENIVKLCRHCKRLKVLHLYGCAHLPAERQIREVNATVKVYPLILT
ncbi:uncharacterized protein LOC119492516 isoform X1 [Sebastes umbrosus]|uniref:uncharacterized protein LOC119492516 isoform X1 n=1 Tax=Sebastes umbrosus TaxID=72105 RepID=UPI00189C934E|nr:uncharacterized protein LOC119492516 isoform X1 [Sebastes umbrosus]